MDERQTIDRGWYYVIEPEQGRWAPIDRRITADDGAVLTRRLHGYPQRIEVVDASGLALPIATRLRAASALGRVLEQQGHTEVRAEVVLGAAGTPTQLRVTDRLVLTLDGASVSSSPSHHPLEAEVAQQLASIDEIPAPTPCPDPLPESAVSRVMFFESLMNTDMPHNDKEISQGVLHMVSTLAGLDTEVVLVNAKMSIVGAERPVLGLERIEAALEGGPVGLVCITLLEGYWDGVVRLISTLRSLGCRAHIAVGGVMPSLAPEHVAAHLDDVSFVCRGAGEYFVPKLARILGDHDIDTPLTAAQRDALLRLDGMIVVDPAGGRLLSCQSARTMQVESLDRVDLDLQYLATRHIEGGVEISTSRGCIHKCSFCSILGRESYQARSAGGIFGLFETYQRRFEALYGDRIPNNAYRVHFSDDDFACDRDRTRDFFLRLRETPFRLSSVQVAIGDLCVKRGGRVMPEPDHELLDAMPPECFADHGRPIPKVDFYEDHRSRQWSSFLQIGVETYSDREIARLGKGYKVVHVRAIVAELARRGMHMDGYFILSNADTEARDLVDVFSEVARLKLRFPAHFHMRFPVVQHLVSYFTAASHRRHVRRGRRELMMLRDHASVPSHPELDYPFVEHDVPRDGWVRETVADTFVTDEGLYTANLEVIRAMWSTRYKALPIDDSDRPRIARLLRQLDDRPRRLVFEMLRHAWKGDPAWPGAKLDREVCLETAEIVLGRHQDWMPRFRRYVRAPDDQRLVVLAGGPDGPTPDPIMLESLELLFSTEHRELAWHLTGAPEAINADDLARWTTAAAARAAQEPKRTLRVVVEAAALADPSAATGETQLTVHTGDLHDHLPLASLARVVLRLAPNDAEAVTGTIAALIDRGARQLVIEPHGQWTDDAARILGRELFAVAPRVPRHRWTSAAGADRSPIGLDVAVSWDGQITRSDHLLPTATVDRATRLGHVDELSNIDRHSLELGDSGHVPAEARVLEGRNRADKVLRSFFAWLDSRTEERPASGARP